MIKTSILEIWWEWSWNHDMQYHSSDKWESQSVSWMLNASFGFRCSLNFNNPRILNLNSFLILVDLVGHRLKFQNTTTYRQAKPTVLALSLEFDASSIKTRVRSGLLEVDSMYHMLVTWHRLNCSICLHIGFTVLFKYNTWMKVTTTSKKGWISLLFWSYYTKWFIHCSRIIW